MSSAIPMEDPRAITRDELIRQLGAAHVTLVDVLSPESFGTNHIPGAISLPVADIPARASSFIPDRRASIVVYCGGPT